MEYEIQKVEKVPAKDFAEKTQMFGHANGNKVNAGADKANGKNDGKAAGWMNDDKFQYSDRNVQDLIKQVEVPGVGGELGAKSQGAEENAAILRPQHKPKIQFKISEALQQEAAKVNDYLEKLVVRMNDETSKNNAKQSKVKPDGANNIKAKATGKEVKAKNPPPKGAKS